MSKPENPPAFPHTVFWAILGVLLGASFQLHDVRDALDRQTSAYLCVENWKLGNEPMSCKELLAERERAGQS